MAVRWLTKAKGSKALSPSRKEAKKQAREGKIRISGEAISLIVGHLVKAG